MDSSTALAIQSWVLYALAVSLVFARVLFRRITLSSFSFLQADDWIMVSVLVPYTAAIVMANVATSDGTPKQSNVQYAIEELQLVVTWLVKACLLVLYWRIFPIISSSFKHTSIKVISGICVISFLAIQVSLVVWRLSKPNASFLNGQDSPHITYQIYTGVTLSLSALTTLFVLVIPVPFIPTPRRFLLGILIVFGILALCSGIIARISLFNRHSDRYLFWYTSESALVIIFANLPFLTAPARVRDFSRKLSSSAGQQQRPLSQWPRSRSSGQVEECHNTRLGSAVGSTTTTASELPSLKELCDSSLKSYTSERGISSGEDVEMQLSGTDEQARPSR